MKTFAVRLAGVSLAALAAAGCTTSGIGTGQAIGQNVGATFSWTENGASRGVMIAQLSNGQVFQGPFFQITQESVVSDYGPLWNGWGPSYYGSRYGWGGFPYGGYYGSRWGSPYGYGWNGWGPWGPSQETITHYSGQVLANLQGPGGFMRCDFRLMRPQSGMAGGGAGQCQLPTGTIIQAQFPPQRGIY